MSTGGGTTASVSGSVDTGRGCSGSETAIASLPAKRKGRSTGRSIVDSTGDSGSNTAAGVGASTGRLLHRNMNRYGLLVQFDRSIRRKDTELRGRVCFDLNGAVDHRLVRKRHDG